MFNTCEDIIEGLSGLHENKLEVKLEKSDINLIYSLARQTYKGVGYTDRQYELAKKKVLHYKSQLEDQNLLVDLAVETTRIPLRSIDRSRWVKIVDHPGNSLYKSEDKGLWIALRFIFQKKLISNIESLKIHGNNSEAIYDKENKIHYFPFNETNVDKVVSLFNSNNGFDVQEELQTYYEKIQEMKNNKEDYIPTIKGFKINKLSKRAFDYAITTIGHVNEDTLLHYYDRRDLLGIGEFDESDVNKSLKNVSHLTERIVLRNKNQVLVNSNKYTLEQLSESLLELNRFPLLVVLESNNAFDELTTFYKLFNSIIPNELCSVLFRQDNVNDGVYFNQFVKEKSLNNAVDKDTKIVYINSTKVPKPLLQADWRPNAILTTQAARRSPKVASYLESSDLVLHYDTDTSAFLRGMIYKA